VRFASSRFVRGWGLALAAAAALSTSPGAGRGRAATLEPAPYPAPPGTRLVIAPLGVGSPIDELERRGFRVAVAIPPRNYYVVEVRGLHLLPPGFDWGGPPSSTAPLGAPLGLGEGASSDSGTAALSLPGGEPPSGQHPFGGRIDALPPLRPPSARRALGAPSLLGEAPGLYHGTRWGDTSEFMIGRVAVGLLFAESDGTLDPSQYDWTPELRDSLITSTLKGLARWATRATGKGIPLTFVLEIHPSLPTRYEPINREVAEEALWIADVLAPVAGRSGDAAGEAYDVANALRSRLGTQWAYLIFGVHNGTVQNPMTDPVRPFPDGYIAHSRLGGPWIVMPVSEPQGALDYYVEHETTHMFWALDEYPAAGPSGGWWACTLVTGYFPYPNSNSSIPVPGYCCYGCHYTCIMDGNYPGQVCPYTEGQVGWVDNDASGTIDFFETRAEVHPDSVRFHALTGQVKTLGGVAQEVAIPNRNPYHAGAGDSISVARIDSVEMRIAGGPWTSLTAADGRFDTGQERFTVDVGPLPLGNYLVEWRAWNSNGLVTLSPASSILEVSPSGQAAGVEAGTTGSAPSLRAGPNPGTGPIAFTVTARPGTRGVARLHGVSGRLIWSTRLEVPASGRIEGLLAAPHDAAAVASGLYFLTVEIDGAKMTRRLVLLR
jgi:hypothetical protein